jgi:hypothetical protein
VGNLSGDLFSHSAKVSPHTSAAQQELSAGTLEQTNISASASSFHSATEQQETAKSEHPTSVHSTKASPHVSETLPSDQALQSFHSPVQTELDHSSPTPDYPDSTHSIHSTKTSPHVSAVQDDLP